MIFDKKNKEKKQLIQSNQYNFPYHYIPVIDSELKDFKSFKNWNFSLSYSISYLKILELLSKKNPKKHIDIGCGDGRLINELSTKLSQISFTGLDYDQKSIDWANMFKNEKNVNFICLDIENVEKNIYNSASLIETLEHIPLNKVEKSVKDISNIILPGGDLYITVPHSNQKVSEKHYQHFNFDTLKKLFNDEFNIVSIKGFDKSSFFQKMINKFLKNRLWFFEIYSLNKIILNNKYKFFDNENHVQRIFLHLTKK